MSGDEDAQLETAIGAMADEGAGPVDNRSAWFALPWTAVAIGLSLIVFALIFGLPSHLPMGEEFDAFAMKVLFTLTVTLAGTYALGMTSRPGLPVHSAIAAIIVPFLALALISIAEAIQGARIEQGNYWWQTALAVLLLSPIGFALGIRAVRQLAPVRLRLCGFAAGIMGSGAAACALTLFHHEAPVLHLLSGHALPMLLIGGIGALLGPPLLKW